MPPEMPDFRADHVGSLLRPAALRQAFKDHLNGKIDDAAFRAAQNKAIDDAVHLQEDAGLVSITDGEFRRASYWARFVERVDGLEVRDALFSFRDDHGHEQAFTAPHVVGPVNRSRPIAEDEFVYLREATDRVPKITLPSPPTMHFWRMNRAVDPGAYDSRDALFSDLARVFEEEIAALAARGATYIQLDEVPLAMLCDPAVRAKVADAGLDPVKLIGEYVGLLQKSVQNRPRSVAAAIHLCRGNFKGSFLSEGGYDEIAERLFNDVPVDAYFLEYDTPRAGDFEPLRLVPKGKRVVLGLVSTKTPELESADDLRRRIDEAAKFIDLDQLGLSPQCGFASTVAGNPVTEDDEKSKLARIVEVADSVWG